MWWSSIRFDGENSSKFGLFFLLFSVTDKKIGGNRDGRGNRSIIAFSFEGRIITYPSKSWYEHRLDQMDTRLESLEKDVQVIKTE